MRAGRNLKIILAVLLMVQGVIIGCATAVPASTDVFSTAMSDENTERPALVWERELTEGCQTMTIGDQEQASFGPCFNPSEVVASALETGPLDELRYFQDRYQSLEADTPAGWLSFEGRGTQMATPSEMQALAEWATLVHQQLQFGRSGASWGLAVALNEEGSAPCCRIQIEVYGKVFANECRGGIQPMATAWLTTEQVDRLYAWMNEFQTSEMKWNEGGLPMRLVFSGRGERVATEAEQREILAWVNGIYQSLPR